MFHLLWYVCGHNIYLSFEFYHVSISLWECLAFEFDLFFLCSCSDRPYFCRAEPEVFKSLFGVKEKNFNKEACRFTFLNLCCFPITFMRNFTQKSVFFYILVVPVETRLRPFMVPIQRSFIVLTNQSRVLLVRVLDSQLLEVIFRVLTLLIMYLG